MSSSRRVYHAYDPPNMMDDLLARYCRPDDFDWESVTKRAESHPKEVRDDALLRILERSNLATPTTDAIKAICKANPRVLKETESYVVSSGRVGEKIISVNALGKAINYNASFDVISTLVQEIVSPTKGKRNKRGRQSTSVMRDCLAHTIIHIDDQRIPLNILSLLLETFPISLFMERGHPMDGRENFLAARIVMNSSKDPDSCWERINVVLTAIFRDATSDPSLVLHRFLTMVSGIGIFKIADDYLVQGDETRTPLIQGAIDILNVIKQRVPGQFRMRDANGGLPLHIALSNTHILKRKDNDSGMYPSELIKYLIKEYPESARLPDKEGRLPLHIAVEHGIPCYGILVDLEDRALTSRCPVTGFYPFQLAEYGLASREKRPRKCSETTAVNMSFHLLRASPHVMNNLVPTATAKEPWIHDSIHKQILANKLKLAQIDYETFLKEKPIQDEIAKLEEQLKKEKDSRLDTQLRIEHE